MIPILSILWFIRTTKVILFYLYLWQLKEYHLGRFLDHFRTAKGKKLLFNKFIFLKLFLLILFLISYFYWNAKWYDPIANYSFIIALFILFLLYFFESVKAFKDFFQDKLRRPILTKKTTLLIIVAIVIEIAFVLFLFLIRPPFIDFYSGILIFDILTPLIVSAIVLIFQPLAVLGRSQIIRKAKDKRNKFKNLLVIGITGSYGKTSTKEFLAQILSEKFKVLKTKEHQNSEVGISQCILNNLKPEHQVFVVEMGAYNRGGIKLLSDICQPKIGILTGINEQHLATFGSQENIIKGKYELIESLPPDGLAIFNGDNPHCLELYKKTMIKKIVYSLQSSISGKPPDIWAHQVKTEKEFISFRAYSKADSADFKVNVLGIQNVLNILGAVAVAKELGMSLPDIARACQKIEPWQSGIQLKKGIDGLNILDASYSANPTGVISHLEYLKIWPNKKIMVMPCLIELGQASREVHKRIGQKIGEVCDLAIITTKERFKEIKEGAIEKEMKEENIIFIENPKEIFEKIKNFCQKDDVVLLESRVPKQLIQQLTINNESL